MATGVVATSLTSKLFTPRPVQKEKQEAGDQHEQQEVDEAGAEDQTEKQEQQQDVCLDFGAADDADLLEACRRSQYPVI